MVYRLCRMNSKETNEEIIQAVEKRTKFILLVSNWERKVYYSESKMIFVWNFEKSDIICFALFMRTERNRLIPKYSIGVKWNDSTLK